MVEINAIANVLSSVAADDELPIWDDSASQAARITRANLLSGVAFAGGNHNFGTSTITSLTATAATIPTLTVSTSMSVGSGGADLAKILRDTDDLTYSDITTLNAETQTMTISGASTSDHLSFCVQETVPDGVIVTAWISLPDTISVKLYNTTGSTISGATYTVSAVVMRFL